jgi:hypothetical protein
MNEQRFGLPGRTENPEVPKQPEDKERATQETPESATESKEQASEHEARYNELATEHAEIAHEVGKAITLGFLMREGVQTLVNQYGNERFFDAIRQVKASGVEVPTTLDVIKQLEPDPKKRSDVYSQIESDAQAEHEAFDQWEQDPDHDEKRYHYYGTRDTNSLQGTKFRATAYRTLDSFLGKFTGGTSKLFLETGAARGMRDLVSLSEEELGALQTKLNELENDVSRLTAEMGHTTDERTEQLRSQAETLTNELDQEIKRISDEANTRLEEWRTQIVSDLSKVGSLGTASDEMRGAIEGVLQKVEGDIATRVQAVESEIEEKTAPLKDLKQKAEGLHRTY